MTELLSRLRGALRPGIARAVAGAGAPKRALLLYTVAAFRAGRSRHHQNLGQQRELAEALAERGFEVDVVDFGETRRALLTRDYHLVVDLFPREPALYRERLAPGAVRIAYITGSNPDVSNPAERGRLTALETRRGVSLAPRRQIAGWSGRVLESFDAMFYFGGATTLATFTGLRLPQTHRLPNSGWDVEPTDPALRDPRRFLFLASAGQVHKGLDRLLEVFRDAPDLHLEVCSAFRAEPDFVRAYRRELFETPNIHAHDLLDLRGARFRELQSRCGTSLLPSCAEGQAGTVTVALAYGLPSVVSRESGFDEPEVATFADCEIATLAAAVRALAGQDAAALARRSAESLALYRRAYRPEHFASAVRAALDHVLACAGAAR
jgi:glycosyltransferase involved in cell wall biosynthesis